MAFMTRQSEVPQPMEAPVAVLSYQKTTGRPATKALCAMVRARCASAEFEVGMATYRMPVAKVVEQRTCTRLLKDMTSTGVHEPQVLAACAAPAESSPAKANTGAAERAKRLRMVARTDMGSPDGCGRGTPRPDERAHLRAQDWMRDRENALPFF